MIAALALGRKGSKGFPGKNTYKILGRPLAYYPMKAAKDTKEVEMVYLSTNDPELTEIARDIGAEVIERPEQLCTSTALGEDAFVHGYKEIKRLNPGKEIEQIVLLFCNAPLVTPKIISEGIKALRENPHADSAVSVSKYNMWSPLRARRIDTDGFLKPFVPLETFGDPKTLNCDRDSQGDVWFADMGVSIVRPACLERIDEGLLPQKWMGRRIYPLRQSAGLDVDYEWQIPQAGFWLKKHLDQI